MNIFISWSGKTSMEIAELIKNFIPKVIQFAKPYYTPDDIEKGLKWESEINIKLAECTIGLICLTKDNTDKPWILFEAGALSNRLDKAKVCPILFGIKKSEITGPLSTFQLTEFTKIDFLKLIKSINKSLDEFQIDESNLTEVFDAFYPKLEKEITEILKFNENSIDPKPKRKDREILEEILILVRRQVSQKDNLSILEKRNLQQHFNQILDTTLRNSKDIEMDFKPGDYVVHERFGKGQIIHILDLDPPKVSVKFDDFGQKNLYVSYANLKKNN